MENDRDDPITKTRGEKPIMVQMMSQKSSIGHKVLVNDSRQSSRLLFSCKQNRVTNDLFSHWPQLHRQVKENKKDGGAALFKSLPGFFTSGNIFFTDQF